MTEIRSASIQDINTIQALAVKIWWPTYSGIVSDEQIAFMLDRIYSTEALTNCIQNKEQEFVLLFENNIEQGFAAFGVRPEDSSICKLHKLYVLPTNQKKGFGKLLIENIKSRLKDRNISIMDLNVNRQNTALSFYERMGFTILKEEDVAIGPYWMTDYVMRLKF